MNGFVFQLQTLLDLRSSAERERAGELAMTRAELATARAQQAAVYLLLQSGREQLAGAAGDEQTAGSLQNRLRVLDELERRARLATERVRAAELREGECLRAYNTAHQERRVLDRLRERKAEDWSREQVELDQHEMDAIATGRHGRSAQETTCRGAA